MTNVGVLKVTTPAGRHIVMTRVFDAPRTQVFEGMTRLVGESVPCPVGWAERSGPSL
jgi:hypothetical protein